MIEIKKPQSQPTITFKIGIRILFPLALRLIVRFTQIEGVLFNRKKIRDRIHKRMRACF